MDSVSEIRTVTTTSSTTNTENYKTKKKAKKNAEINNRCRVWLKNKKKEITKSNKERPKSVENRTSKRKGEIDGWMIITSDGVFCLLEQGWFRN